MLMQRNLQQSLRRLVVQQPGLSRSSFVKLAGPAAVAASHVRRQTRQAATTTIKKEESYDILVQQRLNRPVSPHLSIYRPQMSWVGSILNRLTGSILSGGFYIFGFTYLVAPVFGWHIESDSIAAAFGSLPATAKVALKFGIALPFTYHGLNGIRHVVWDTGRQLGNKQVQTTGWAVTGLTLVGSGVLAYI